MKTLLIIATLISFTSCSTIKKIEENKNKAKDVSRYVQRIIDLKRA